VIAFGTPDHAAAKVLHVDYVGHQLIEHVGQKQICAGHRPVVLVPQLVDQVVEGSGQVDLGKEIGLLAQEGHRLPVKDHFDIGKPAGARRTHLVGPGQIDRARTRQQ
jgi:hypothetical protein